MAGMAIRAITEITDYALLHQFGRSTDRGSVASVTLAGAISSLVEHFGFRPLAQVRKLVCGATLTATSIAGMDYDRCD